MNPTILTPYVESFSNKCFGEIKNKMVTSPDRGFYAKFGSYSIASYQAAGRIMVTLYTENRENYISFSASANKMDKTKLNEQCNGGNFAQIIKMIESVKKDWDVQKFKACEAVGPVSRVRLSNG